MNARILSALNVIAGVFVLSACGSGGQSSSESVSTNRPAASTDEPVAASIRPATSGGQFFISDDRDSLAALGPAHESAFALYQAMSAEVNGGAALSVDDMPDWSGLWVRDGNPFYDPQQDFSQLTTANLRPESRAELRRRRELSTQGIEYDPISDCSPPGFPRWLAIPFLREFIVTPAQVWLASETVNNIRRIYTDGRDHLPELDRYPLWYGDSIAFWTGHTLVIHTNQLRANIFHRNDPRHSDQIETVEVWRKTGDDTMVADVWAYDPETLVEPWYTRQTFKKLTNDDGALRVRHWHCSENENNLVIQTDEGTSQFGDFTFTGDE
jgi:hypothetical protein